MKLGIAKIRRLGFMAWEWEVQIQDDSGHERATLGGHRRTFFACVRAVGGKGASGKAVIK